MGAQGSRDGGGDSEDELRVFSVSDLHTGTFAFSLCGSRCFLLNVMVDNETIRLDHKANWEVLVKLVNSGKYTKKDILIVAGDISSNLEVRTIDFVCSNSRFCLFEDSQRDSRVVGCDVSICVFLSWKQRATNRKTRQEAGARLQLS